MSKVIIWKGTVKGQRVRVCVSETTEKRKVWIERLTPRLEDDKWELYFDADIYAQALMELSFMLAQAALKGGKNK